mmetsp:Transcript_40381/g.82498  ORF Transcript_40381/g.82498 Transcript_40381/m.82498 type:complete len:99 (+) Transcript_40381:205-501(+)
MAIESFGEGSRVCSKLGGERLLVATPLLVQPGGNGFEQDHSYAASCVILRGDLWFRFHCFAISDSVWNFMNRACSKMREGMTLQSDEGPTNFTLEPSL